MMVVASAARRARYCGMVMPPRSCSPRKVLSVTGVASLPARIKLARCLEDAAVQFLGKMLRLQKIGNTVEGVVIDQDGAEKRLFGLDIGRRGAKRRVRRGDGQGLTIKSLFQRCHVVKAKLLRRPKRTRKRDRYRGRRRITRSPDGHSGMAAPIRKSKSRVAPPRPRYSQQRKKGGGPMAIALDRGARDTGMGRSCFFCAIPPSLRRAGYAMPDTGRWRLQRHEEKGKSGTKRDKTPAKIEFFCVKSTLCEQDLRLRVTSSFFRFWHVENDVESAKIQRGCEWCALIYKNKT